jgi:hypothetical protein
MLGEPHRRKICTNKKAGWRPAFFVANAAMLDD